VIGHYDIAVSQLVAVPNMLGTAYKYTVKYVALVHFFPYDIRSTVYGIGDIPVLQIVMGLTFIGIAYYAYKVKEQHKRLLIAVGACSLVCLLLVLPLYFYFTLSSENDRYGSLFVPFLSLFFVLGIEKFKRPFSIFIFLSFLVVNMYFQQKMISQWAKSQNILEQLTSSFPAQLNGKTLLLNLPENYNGTFMFRDFSGQAPLIDHLRMMGRQVKDLDCVGQYNIPMDSQALELEYLDDVNKIKLEFSEWGSWWWKTGKGATDYENERFKVEFKGKFYELTLKDTSYYN